MLQARASRARIHKLDAYKRQRKHQSLGTDYYIERDKPSQRRGKIKDYDRKAKASCPGPSHPTPGRQSTPRSSTRLEGSSSSSRRSRQQGRQSQGLRHLSVLNGYGEKESKANVSTHPKYSASKDLHYICNIFKVRLYMWTRLQKCQNRG